MMIDKIEFKEEIPNNKKVKIILHKKFAIQMLIFMFILGFGLGLLF
jgi:hypothetical protein